jgi:hypothetical protein
MSTQGATKTTVGEIWGRLIQPKDGTFSPTAARAILALSFPDDDQARMHELAQKNGEGKLSSAEKEELESYILVADVLALLHAKARRSLLKR